MIWHTARQTRGVYARTMLTLARVAETLNLEHALSSDARRNTRVGGITLDPLSVSEGDVFVALKMDHFNGCEFVDAAIDRGAAAVVCPMSQVLRERHQAMVFRVDDTLDAFRRLAGAWRRAFEIPIIAVAGSVGKTTTKELLAAILSGRWTTLKTHENRNTFVGVPSTLLELRGEDEAAVIEVGIDDVGAMAKQMELIQPTGVIVTAIAPEHLENLHDLETVANEELIALKWVGQADGLIAVNLDDERIRPFANQYRRAISFTTAEAGFEPNVVFGRRQASRCTICYGSRSFELPVPLPGHHNLSNLLGAVAIALGLGLNEEEILAGLTQFTPPSGRSELKTLPQGARVLCDHFNSSPAAVRAALSTLVEIEGKRLRVCLGDMFELGENAAQFHRELAQEIIGRSIDEVLLIGERMRHLAEELGALHFAGIVRHFESHGQMAEHLKQDLAEDDRILIKGSRAMKMEQVLSFL
jgi:UDP-N-acetylmuramoyl-tripeptide--D-alanyl-D-alanine ligase